MSLENFEGYTFVAFTDIAGFKQLMHTPDRARDALYQFYAQTYEILRNQDRASSFRVDGLLVSDCAVLFVRPPNSEAQDQLRALLVVLKRINHVMLSHDLMLSTSISYGGFTYRPSDEFPGIEKNLIIGNPYVEAYLDQSAGRPKLEPGQCRLLRDHIPDGTFPLPVDDEYFSLVRAHGAKKHSYFYWMCRGPQDVDDFERRYRDSYNLKYSGMLDALKTSTSKNREM